jgi:soluble lytic murein transglycosylase
MNKNRLIRARQTSHEITRKTRELTRRVGLFLSFCRDSVSCFVDRPLFMIFVLAAIVIARDSLSSASPIPQAASDESLASVRRSDRAARDATGKLNRLEAVEHLRRANVYMTNREFAAAREHWEALIAYYPQDPNVPAALFGIGRSYFQERRYDDAFSFYDRVAKNYPQTKEGREGLNFSAASLLRLGQPSKAVERYREYIEKYPSGERYESAHLNIIDTLREAGRPGEAIQWAGLVREKFANTPTYTNALFALLRLHVAEGNWQEAIAAAEELRNRGFQKGVLTTADEVAYLRGYSLEHGGRTGEAINTYLGIADGLDSYYGWLATQRLQNLTASQERSIVVQRKERVREQIAASADSYRAPYREAILRTARTRKLDPRFVLAMIKQESVFRPFAKSPSGARGLLQLTIDAAQKYAPSAGLNALSENQLYRPETSILVGSQYLAELSRLFPDRLEAVAASYNGGEDNVARWIKRAKQNDPGVFTADIGFDETKAYVQKVMANYRAYQQLYTAELKRR